MLYGFHLKIFLRCVLYLFVLFCYKGNGKRAYFRDLFLLHVSNIYDKFSLRPVVGNVILSPYYAIVFANLVVRSSRY